VQLARTYQVKRGQSQQESSINRPEYVNIEGEYGNTVHANFRNLQYVPVKLNSFETIEVNIKNDQNENVSFEFGKSIATLHFRQKRSQYFFIKMRGRLVVDAKLLKDHFLRQQRGGNIAGFRGARMQRGYGIGGIFKSLARYAIPLFKQGAKIVGKRALQAATEVGQDVFQGKKCKRIF
jgi:hypothetical protein